MLSEKALSKPPYFAIPATRVWEVQVQQMQSEQNWEIHVRIYGLQGRCQFL